MTSDFPHSNRYLSYLQQKKDAIRAFYDREASRYAATWIEKNAYYYDQIKRLLAGIISPGVRVLDAGCGCGHMLDCLRPAYGVGIDFSAAMIEQAARRYPHLHFEQLDFEDVGSLGETFDFVVVSNAITEMTDIRRCLKSLKAVMTPATRLVIVTYNYLWEPVLEAGARLGMRPRSPAENWISPRDIENLLHTAGFETVRSGYRTALPRYVPGLAELCNNLLVRMPFCRRIGVTYYAVARPLMPFEGLEEMGVSVVVPCKNEEDNIAELVKRVPQMGSGTELIFVDDKSTDRTAPRIREQLENHPGKNIKLVEGPGKGKGAACRAGFSQATHDVFMILDADMTVMPEVLPEFFELIANGTGEFINGSRLMYPMEQQAMRLANVFGNKMFAMLFTFLLEQPIKDTLCGTKVVLKRDYQKLIASREYFGDIDRWGDYDWIFGAARSSLKIVELPVHYVSRTAGETKMTGRLRNAWIMLKMCWAAFIKLKLA